MRYVIHGAGSVGSVLGCGLHRAGHDVVLIARGAHGAAMRRDGLLVRHPSGDVRARVPVVGTPAEARLEPGDVVLLTTKTQDAAAALDDLAAAAPPGIAVFCAQNGVENERQALRRFPRVYGVAVMLPASVAEPGVVHAFGAPRTGILDVGRYPEGADDTAAAVAAALESGGFSSRVDTRVMRLKYRKLVRNMHNVVEALAGAAGRTSELADRARAEALAAFAAAGLDVATEDEDRRRRAGVMEHAAIAGATRTGGSSWQSLARGAGSIETDYLNGEIVLLGRLHGVPTPVNAALQELARRAARGRVPPASTTLHELSAQVDARPDPEGVNVT